MSRNWTKEQMTAISAAGSDILVAAAAGSGKTAVLVERIIKIITSEKNPVDIDKLLVLTFTKAAAAEMRERIGTSLYKMLDENPSSTVCQRQIPLLSSSKITTIHSFCKDVVKNNYTLVGLDPAFRVADDAEAELLKYEAIEEYFEIMYSSENNEGFLSLVESYGEGTGDTKLKELIINIHRFVQSSPFPEEWINKMSERFNVSSNESIENTFWGELLKQDVIFELEGLKVIAENGLYLCSQYSIPEYEKSIKNDIAIVDELISSLKLGLEKLYYTIWDVDFSSIGRKKKDSDTVAAERIKEIHKNIKDSVYKIRDKFFFKQCEFMIDDIKSLYPVIKALGNTVIGFSEMYEYKKREKQLVDFNDLEHYCLKILLDEKSTENNAIPSNVAYEIQERFAEILVDEYQDSNIVQEMILSVVSGRGRGEHNRFMVGDVKQSIYRFRLAMPEIFTNKYADFSYNNSGTKIDLFKNFRSRKEVIDGINFVFMQLMNEKVGDVVYDDKAALSSGADFPGFEGNIGGAVELDILDLKFNTEGFEDVDIEDMTGTELEAKHAAERIKKLFNDGYMVYDNERGCYRNIEYRDIVVLLRSVSSQASTYSNIFSNSGLPCYAESRTGYFESSEVQLIMCILNIIDNPIQDIPLLTVLHSPIYKLSCGELAEIRSYNGSGNFYHCVLDYAYKFDNKKLIRFIDDIKRWRAISVNMPIEDLIKTIYSDTGYYDYIGILPDGAIRQSNLKSLLDRAEEYESFSFKGLFHFVRYIDRLKKNNNDFGESSAFGENENLIKIMSIHKSKGLEFPVVLICGLGKKFNKSDTTKPILLHQTLGFGSNYIDYENRVKYETISKSVIASSIEKETLSEEMRVLYVAMTRAKEKLILTGGIKNIEKSLLKWTGFINEKNIGIHPYPMLKAANYLDWIVPAVARHRDGELIRERAGIISLGSKNGVYDHSSVWKVSIVPVYEVIFESYKKTAENRQTALSLFDFDISKDYSGHKKYIESRLNWKYKYVQSVPLPANISISEIKRLYQERIYDESEGFVDIDFPNFREPEFLKEKKPLTAAQRGTALHMLLERLDFKKKYSIDDIENEKKKYVEKGILSQAEADSIKSKRVFEFLESDICRRIANSNEVKKELPFALSLKPYEIYGPEAEDIDESILVHGIIDCCFYENGEAVLIDYKTDYVSPNGEKEVIKKYELQLKYYKIAIERILGIKVKEVWLYLFSIGKAFIL